MSIVVKRNSVMSKQSTLTKFNTFFQPVSFCLKVICVKYSNHFNHLNELKKKKNSNNDSSAPFLVQWINYKFIFPNQSS